MANNTIPQAGLPEKQWFTLQEVATRWAGMTGQAVSVDDVLHYEDIGALSICGLTNLHVAQNAIASLPITLCVSLESVAAQLRVSDVVEGFLDIDLGGSEAITKIFNEFGVTPVSPKQKHELLLPRELLRIERDELHRFEQTHDIGQPAPNETEPQIIEESAKQAPAQDDWIARARELYTELKQEKPRLNQNQLAYEIELKLKTEGYLGRGKKPLKASNIIRNALQNL